MCLFVAKRNGIAIIKKQKYNKPLLVLLQYISEKKKIIELFLLCTVCTTHNY